MTSPFPSSLARLFAALIITLVTVIPAAAQNAEQPDTRPLSPAQIALFETPHLHNISAPITLEYRFLHSGPDGFADTVSERIQKINPDTTKYVTFNFLTGDRHVPFPAVDNFSGNPLLMLFLENDVRTMKSHIGVAAAYFRNHIRAAFVDRAKVTDTTFTLNGHVLPARLVTLQPFADDPRFAQVPALRNKTYSFVLADGVPGTVAELSAEMPADPDHGAPASGDRLTYVGEKP
jgi:hypothetical protein